MPSPPRHPQYQYPDDVSRLSEALISLNERKLERERLARAEARQAELDRAAQAERDRKARMDEDLYQISLGKLQQDLAAQTEMTPGGKVKIEPQKITLEEPPLPAELQPTGGMSPDELAVHESTGESAAPKMELLNPGMDVQAPDVLPMGRTYKARLSSGEEIPFPMRYKQEVEADEARKEQEKLTRQREFAKELMDVPDDPKLFGPFAGKKGVPASSVNTWLNAQSRQDVAEQNRIAREEAAREARAGREAIARMMYGNANLGGADALLQDAVGAAGIGQPRDRRRSMAEEVKRRLDRGDEDGARQFITQSIINTENVDRKNDLQARNETLAILDHTEGTLRKLEDKGVEMGVLSGNLEDGLRKLGETRDPELVALANELKQALFAYRKAMTGVQFSVKESADYERMFPGYKNEYPVNYAAIRGLRNGFKLRNNTYWETRVGPEVAGYLGVLKPLEEGTLGGASNVRVQKNKRTGETRYSTDGGATWQPGLPQ